MKTFNTILHALLLPLTVAAAAGCIKITPDPYVPEKYRALMFTTEGTATLSYVCRSSAPDEETSVDLELSIDGKSWNDFPEGLRIPFGRNNLGTNDTLYVRGLNPRGLSTCRRMFRFSIGGESDVKCSGPVMSLINWKGGDASIPGYAFLGVFCGCRNLIEAPSLPDLPYTQYCFAHMFRGCERLAAAPQIRNGHAGPWSCAYMYADCKALVEGPDLHMDTVYENGLEGMFTGCSGLQKSGQMSFGTLSGMSLYGLFDGCPQLREVTIRGAFRFEDTPANAFRNWLRGVAGEGTLYTDHGREQWTQGKDGVPLQWEIKPEKI